MFIISITARGVLIVYNFSYLFEYYFLKVEKNWSQSNYSFYMIFYFLNTHNVRIFSGELIWKRYI